MASNLLMIGITLQLYDRMTSNLKAATGGLDKLREKADKLRSVSVGLMADGFLAAGAAAGPIKAYADLDEALTGLQVSMMQRGGKVGAAFEPLKKQIVELGNKLPGTTADYAQLAETMISLGTPAEKLLGGALDAAANLRVVLDMTSEAAGETVVKLREAYNLSDGDLAKTADTVQRAKFAFGMKPEELRVAASYQSAQLNILHLSGAENMKKMLVLQGMANLKGLDGSSFGTNMAMMLQRLATGPKMLEIARRGMRGVGKDILGNLGISFDFFDKKGNFRGLDAMIKEFEKFKIIQAKYGDKGVSEVSNALFGIEAARPAMILAQYGEAGYQAAMKSFNEQAALQERIDRILRTWINVWRAFTGTVTNLMAAFSGPLVEGLKPYIDKLNELTGGPLMEFVDQHKTLAKWLGAAVLLFAGVALGLGALGLAFAGVLRYVALVAPIVGPVVRVFRRLVPVVSGLAWMVRLLAVAIGKDLWKAVLMVARFAMANPLVALAVGIAAAAIWVITHWDKVKKWFSDFWDWLKDGIRQLNSWMPDWMRKYTLPGAAINLVAKTLGPEKPSAAGAGKAHVSGQVDVVVHDDGRKPTVSVKRAQGGMGITAYAGHTMVTQ